MTPPAATVDTFDTFTTTKVLDDKVVNGTAKVTLNGNGHVGNQTKLLDDFGGKWDSFKFAPIRESQVSRAMTRRYFADLDRCTLAPIQT